MLLYVWWRDPEIKKCLPIFPCSKRKTKPQSEFKIWIAKTNTQFLCYYWCEAWMICLYVKNFQKMCWHQCPLFSKNVYFCKTETIFFSGKTYGFKRLKFLEKSFYRLCRFFLVAFNFISIAWNSFPFNTTPLLALYLLSRYELKIRTPEFWVVSLTNWPFVPWYLNFIIIMTMSKYRTTWKVFTEPILSKKNVYMNVHY